MSDELNEPAEDLTPEPAEIEPAEPTRPAPSADTDSDDDEELGPKGQQALARMKEARRLAARQKREAIRERDALRAELEEVKASLNAKDDDDAKAARDAKAIRKEAEEAAKAQVRAEMLKDRVADKIEVLAAKRAQDPEVVRTLLLANGHIDDFLDGSKIDVEAIKEALDELLEKQPYLAAQGAKRFQGSGDGGARKGPKGPSQLTDDDLKRMTAEEIVQAHEQGRFDQIIGANPR